MISRMVRRISEQVQEARAAAAEPRRSTSSEKRRRESEKDLVDDLPVERHAGSRVEAEGNAPHLVNILVY